MTAVPSARAPSAKSFRVIAKTFSVIGDGRAGGAFSRALTQVGWTLVAVHRRGNRSPRAVSLAASNVDLLLLTVPDRVVSETARMIQPGTAAVAHVAGSLPLSALAPHQRVASIHPLMSLPDADRGAARLLDRCTFATDGDPIADLVVADLGGIAVHVEDRQRPLYHATACVASNHLVALCGQVERLASSLGVPIEAYWKLMTTTLTNVGEDGAARALTGPAARGDWETIEGHLANLPERERHAYCALGEQAAILAGRDWPEGLR